MGCSTCGSQGRERRGPGDKNTPTLPAHSPCPPPARPRLPAAQLALTSPVTQSPSTHEALGDTLGLNHSGDTLWEQVHMLEAQSFLSGIPGILALLCAFRLLSVKWGQS